MAAFAPDKPRRFNGTFLKLPAPFYYVLGSNTSPIDL
jgi:hypothetical protein